MRTTRLLLLLATTACIASLGPTAASGSSLPSGFRDDAIFTGLEEPTAVSFAPGGRIFVAEKAGRILVFDSLADKAPTVFADLRTQVYDAGDRGALGLALDPEFPARPYVYALYTYDHLLGEAGRAPKWGEPEHSGDDCPKPAGTGVDACPVSGRLVRLTADEGGTGNHAVENGDGEVEEEVLVEGWCQQYSSHSIGDLQFDVEGMLYASGGDGADANGVDYGQSGWPQKNQCGDPPGAIGTGLSPPSAEGGALRSQDARTPADPTGLNGAVIRIDPDSGEGVPGNPMYGSLDQNARRIVAFGLRNPFRFTLDADSGEVYAANVGWNHYEEIDRFAVDPGHAFNSGWPCYEGPGRNSSYEGLGLALCQGLYGEAGATSPPFFFYKHGQEIVPGDGCSPDPGSAISGITVYRKAAFPGAYDGALFFADSVRGCIYVMFPGGDHRPSAATTTTFMSDAGLYPGIDLEVGPEGGLYYVKLLGEGGAGAIHRISYDANAPVARLTANPPWGDEEFEAELDAGASFDPNGDELSYEWDFDGNGTYGGPDEAKVTRTISGDENVDVAVKVSDDSQSSVAQVTLYPGDSPPRPQIEGPSGSLLWRVGQKVDFAGFAEDSEEAGEEVGLAGLSWKAQLYHCPSGCHAHPLQAFPGVGSGSFITPDHDYPAHIEISLMATDSRGLAASKAVSIYPRTVDLAIASDPPGLELSAGLLSQPAPFGLRVIEGSNLVLSAPLSAEFSGGEHSWKGWSDGGSRVHTIVANEPATYTASYAEPPSLPPPVPSPPRTRIAKRPSRLTLSTSARFAFSADQPGAGFRCKLDRGPFKPCRSPRTYRNLRPGKHVLAIVAVNSGGVADPTAAVFRWRVLAEQL
jgi:glucose/arabinose dehydrogenase